MNITQADLDRIAKSNPDIGIRDQMNAEQLSAAVSNGTDGGRWVNGDTGHVSLMPSTERRSAMEQKFIVMWEHLGGPELDEEVRFHASRRWRLDFCHVPTRTAIELEGGAYSSGRHTRGSGFVGDCEKYNAANRLGYTVFRLATGMITPEHIEPIIEHIRKANERREQSGQLCAGGGVIMAPLWEQKHNECDEIRDLIERIFENSSRDSQLSIVVGLAGMLADQMGKKRRVSWLAQLRKDKRLD